jgi:hypothetical protein
LKVVGHENGRVYEFWTARQRAGKTTAIKCRAVDMALHPSVHSVWVLDRLGEWNPRDLRPVKSVAIWHDLGELRHASEMPRIVVWRCGQDAAAYTSILREAAALGDIVVILDEAYEFAPGGAAWTGTPELRAIVLAGAHLPRKSDGELRPCHLIIAAQYPKSCHHQMWAQSYTIMCGLSAGENTFQWLRSNFSRPDYDAAGRVSSLHLYEWECVRGERPALPGYGKPAILGGPPPPDTSKK